MRAVTFHGVSKVSVEELPAPQLVDPTDVVVAVRVAAICGSDLHPYSGRETGLDRGTVMGHEFLGEVVEVGAAVARWAVGDRVVAPFTTSCGVCWYCQRGLTARCELGQLFGWRQGGRGVHGGQADFVRVPLADSTLVRAPAGAADEAALLAGDVLSTGFYCAQLGCIEPEHAEMCWEDSVQRSSGRRNRKPYKVSNIPKMHNAILFKKICINEDLSLKK